MLHHIRYGSDIETKVTILIKLNYRFCLYHPTVVYFNIEVVNFLNHVIVVVVG